MTDNSEGGYDNPVDSNAIYAKLAATVYALDAVGNGVGPFDAIKMGILEGTIARTGKFLGIEQEELDDIESGAIVLLGDTKTRIELFDQARISKDPKREQEIIRKCVAKALERL